MDSSADPIPSLLLTSGQSQLVLYIFKSAHWTLTYFWMYFQLVTTFMPMYSLLGLVWGQGASSNADTLWPHKLCKVFWFIFVKRKNISHHMIANMRLWWWGRFFKWDFLKIWNIFPGCFFVCFLFLYFSKYFIILLTYFSNLLSSLTTSYLTTSYFTTTLWSGLGWRLVISLRYYNYVVILNNVGLDKCCISDQLQNLCWRLFSLSYSSTLPLVCLPPPHWALCHVLSLNPCTPWLCHCGMFCF